MRRPSRRATISALLGRFLIIEKMKDNDIRAPILGMGREVAFSRCIRILSKATTNRHDLELGARFISFISILGRRRDSLDRDCWGFVVLDQHMLEAHKTYDVEGPSKENGVLPS
ncbi:hypothetical protein Q2941_39910 [Bradyrhizobium sp. UFLA05-153]